MVRRIGLPHQLLCKGSALRNLVTSAEGSGAPSPERAKATATKAAKRRWELARQERRNGPPPAMRLILALR